VKTEIETMRRQVRRLRHMVWPGVLIPFLLLAACREKNAYVPPPPPQVGVATPLRQRVIPYLTQTGNTVAYNQVNLVARVQGFLQEIDYVDGAFVQKAQTLFVVEPAPYQAKLQQAQASLNAASADLVQAQAEYKRQATLLSQNVSAQNTYDQALAKRDSDQANVLNQQASVALAAINYGYTRVNAPFDGIVTNHLQSVGELVGTDSNTKLATIVQLDPIYVTFNISEQDVLRVRAAVAKLGHGRMDLTKVPIDVALMTDTTYTHHGNLDYAAPEVDTSTGTLMVRGIIENANRSLLPGYFVRIRVPMDIDTAEQYLVPDIAIGSDQSGRYLLVVDKDDIVHQRTVQTGELVGDLRVITTGLQADDRVVITNTQRAIPGEKVAPQAMQIPPPPPPPQEPAPVPSAPSAPIAEPPPSVTSTSPSPPAATPTPAKP
jgi:membrane fusion protein, multidrug efflux system